MAEAANESQAGPKVTVVPEPEPPASEEPAAAAAAEPGEAPAGPQHQDHVTPACPVALCPICTAVSLVQPLRPDVIEHLLNAGREFLLAAKAVLDARADDMTKGDGQDEGGSLEKIDIG
jgi:hypothetical protein